jgi:hypothetical protein
VKEADMKALNFSELDTNLKRAVFWLADEAETLTSIVLAAAAYKGELWEAKAFFMRFSKGSPEHAQLANLLRHGSASRGTILDCIQKIAPAYKTIGGRCEQELDYLLQEPKSPSASL